MADLSDPSIAGWIQTGGVVAFASAVLLQLRDMKPLFKAIGDTLTEVRTTLSALLERERARAERLAAQDAARRAAAVTPVGGVPLLPFDDEDEVTNPIAIKPRAATSPGLHGPSRPRGGG